MREITISQRSIEIEDVDLPLEQVDLDDDNPRILYKLSLEQEDTEMDDVILAMQEVKNLKRDIKMTGGLRERIYVQKVGKRYVVREGNCRTVCYRALHKEDPKNPAWKKIPASVLPADITAREVAILLSDFISTDDSRHGAGRDECTSKPSRRWTRQPAQSAATLHRPCGSTASASGPWPVCRDGGVQCEQHFVSTNMPTSCRNLDRSLRKRNEQMAPREVGS